MTEPDAAAQPVPDADDDQDDLADGGDPWRNYRSGGGAGSEPPPASTPTARQRRGADDFAAFEEFLQRRRGRRPPATRREQDDEDEDTAGGRSNAGPPPTWDGASEAFRDYEIRAKLWLATTKVRPQARGPLLLKNLSSTPFDDLKHLARDAEWMQSSTNGEELLRQMATKELYGEDEREEMINTLAKVTYTLRRQKGEGHKAFFARWENQIRKLNEHKVVLPPEYLGFLLINALQLNQTDIKLLMNYNQGKLTPKVVKEWTRVNESDLAWRNTETGTIPKKANAILHLDDDTEDPEDHNEDAGEAGEDLEILLNAMEQLEGNEAGPEPELEAFDEDEVKEVLATMVRERGKGSGKRNFKAVADAKKAKGLARGYGVHRDPHGRFGPRGDTDGIRPGNSYKVSIELLKKRTRCKRCHKLGHWHRECPEKDKPPVREAHYIEEENEEALFMHYMDYLNECRDPHVSSSGNQAGDQEPAGEPGPGEFCPSTVQGRHGRAQERDAYMCAALGLPHELHVLESHCEVDEALCATIDTGCQRTAVGRETLNRMLAKQPKGTKHYLKDEVHMFKSVNGTSKTSQVACVPSSLGPQGCILRPAVFDEGVSSKAPFLISLPFLIYCRATLVLDPDQGMKLKFGRFKCEVPLHIGPSGALRVPLGEFSKSMLTTLNRAIDKLVSEATALEALAAEHADGTESERSTESRLNCATKLDSPDLRTSVLHHEGLADEALPQGTGVHLCRGSMAEGGASPDGPHGQCGAAGCDEVHGGETSSRATPGPAPGGDPRPGRRRTDDSQTDAGRCRSSSEQRPGFRRVEHGGRDGSGRTGGTAQTQGSGDGGAVPQLPGTGATQNGEDLMLLQPRGRDHPHKEARTECAPAVRSMPLVERPREKMPVLPLASGRATGHVGVEHPQLPEEPIEKSLGEASKLARPEQVQGFTKRVRFVDEPKHGSEFGNHSLPSQERDLCRIEWMGQDDQMQGLRRSSTPRSHNGGSRGLPRPGCSGSATGATGGQEGATATAASEWLGESRNPAEPDYSSKLDGILPAPPSEQRAGQRRDRGVRGVPAIPGDESRLQEELVEVKLPAKQGRKMSSFLRRSEQMWTDLCMCLTNDNQNAIQELKERVLRESKIGMRKGDIQFYSELLQLEPTDVEKIAKPKPFSVRTKLKLQLCLHVQLDDSLSVPSNLQSLETFLNHERPGLVHLRARDVEFFKEGSRRSSKGTTHIDNMINYMLVNRMTKCYQEVLQLVIQWCKAHKAVFVLEAAMKVPAWWCSLVTTLATTFQLSQFEIHVDNHNYKITGNDPDVNGLLRSGMKLERAYCQKVHKVTTDLQHQEFKDVLREDNRRDAHYFTEGEIYEIQDYQKNPKHNVNKSHEVLDYQKKPKHNVNKSHEVLDYQKKPKHNENKSHEVLAGEVELDEATEDQPEAPIVTGPLDMGVTEEMLQAEGVYKLEGDTVAVTIHEPEVIPRPNQYEECQGYPWRTTWRRREDNTWQLLEDEIRWEELHQPERHLPPGGMIVVLFRKRIDGRPSRHVRNFPGMQNITLERMVYRAHEGLGHPELNRFLRILRLSKASDQAIEIAKKMRCSVCEAYKLPAAARQGAPPREELFINDLVGVDTVHLRNHKGEAVPALNMIDWHSHFQLVVPMETENAKGARQAYRQWIRFFGPPKKVMLDMGSEFKAEFKKQIEADGSETVPGALEAPTQRGLTERAGGIFKDILYKAMMTYTCANQEDWKELVDTTCMTRNRLLLRAGYSPIQRVIGYTPRLPGGLLTGTDFDQGAASLRQAGDLDVQKATAMRKSAAIAFHEADCDQALRAAALAGPRKHRNFEVGQAVYFWRRGAGTTKRARNAYWAGPGRVIMTSLPNAVWISHQGTLIKAAPERVRVATEEEALSLSGWMRGISQARAAFERNPTRNFIDLTKETDVIPEEATENDEGDQAEAVPEPPPGLPAPTRRVRQKTTGYSETRPTRTDPEDNLAERPLADDQADNAERNADYHNGAEGDIEMRADNKREAENEIAPTGKRSRIELLEVYHMNLKSLAKQRQKKEAKVQDFMDKDAKRLHKAILKEINNNLATGAYEILDLKESDHIRPADQRRSWSPGTSSRKSR